MDAANACNGACLQFGAVSVEDLHKLVKESLYIFFAQNKIIQEENNACLCTDKQPKEKGEHLWD